MIAARRKSWIATLLVVVIATSTGRLALGSDPERDEPRWKRFDISPTIFHLAGHYPPKAWRATKTALSNTMHWANETIAKPVASAWTHPNVRPYTSNKLLVYGTGAALIGLVTAGSILWSINVQDAQRGQEIWNRHEARQAYHAIQQAERYPSEWVGMGDRYLRTCNAQLEQLSRDTADPDTDATHSNREEKFSAELNCLVGTWAYFKGQVGFRDPAQWRRFYRQQDGARPTELAMLKEIAKDERWGNTHYVTSYIKALLAAMVEQSVEDPAYSGYASLLASEALASVPLRTELANRQVDRIRGMDAGLWGRGPLGEKDFERMYRDIRDALVILLADAHYLEEALGDVQTIPVEPVGLSTHSNDDVAEAELAGDLFIATQRRLSETDEFITSQRRIEQAEQSLSRWNKDVGNAAAKVRGHAEAGQTAVVKMTTMPVTATAFAEDAEDAGQTGRSARTSLRRAQATRTVIVNPLATVESAVQRARSTVEALDEKTQAAEHEAAVDRQATAEETREPVRAFAEEVDGRIGQAIETATTAAEDADTYWLQSADALSTAEAAPVVATAEAASADTEWDTVLVGHQTVISDTRYLATLDQLSPGLSGLLLRSKPRRNVQGDPLGIVHVETLLNRVADGERWSMHQAIIADISLQLTNAERDLASDHPNSELGWLVSALEKVSP